MGLQHVLDVSEQLWGFYWKHQNSFNLRVCIANISDTLRYKHHTYWSSDSEKTTSEKLEFSL